MTKRSKPSSTPSRATGRARPGAAWPVPEPGDVLSYSYLWAREAAGGQEEGLKDRPVVVVLAILGERPQPQLLVAPVTHAEPESQGLAVELPANVKRDLGLDRDRSWVIATEVNRFTWPGPDLRPLADGSPYYGAIPDWLFSQVQERIGAVAKRGALSITRRTN